MNYFFNSPDDEKLIKMLEYVSEHNDFYKNRIREYGIKNPLDIREWPILTREELQKNRYGMFSDGYKSKYYGEQLRRQSSSGSTGIPVNVYWDYVDWYSSNMCLWRIRRKRFGIKPSDKYCVFTLNALGITPENGKLYFINRPDNLLSFNVSLIGDMSGYRQMAKMIADFEPKWLYIQPFVLNQLIFAYSDAKISPPKSISYIESVGEILTTDLRKKAEDFFGIKITNMYGSEEMNGIAIENSIGEMCVLSDNVFLEIENVENTSGLISGEAVITSLYNRAMPLIRYRQGDIISAAVSKEKNNVGILTTVTGRKFDTVNIGNSILNPACILEAMADVINQYNDAIRGYCFEINPSKRTILCKIEISELKKSWQKSIRHSISETFSKKFSVDGILTFDVEFVIKTDIDRKKREIIKIVG